MLERHHGVMKRLLRAGLGRGVAVGGWICCNNKLLPLESEQYGFAGFSFEILPAQTC